MLINIFNAVGQWSKVHMEDKNIIQEMKTICFKKNQKIPRHNSKRKLQYMVKRKMTSTKLEIFCVTLIHQSITWLKKGDPDPLPPGFIYVVDRSNEARFGQTKDLNWYVLLLR